MLSLTDQGTACAKTGTWSGGREPLSMLWSGSQATRRYRWDKKLMDNEDDEWVEVLKRSGLEGKHFEAKGVSRGEFEALKRFGIYKQLVDGTLMRIEGDKEYRIYCEDAEGWPVRVMTRGFCDMLSELYDRTYGAE
jgi:hypothetical protein